MGLGPLEISGSIQRVTDFANIRQGEEIRGLADQSNFAGQLNKEVNNRTNTVERGDDTNNNQKRFDARDKGSNEYSGDGGRKREENDKKKDGVVRPKGMTSTFDIRI